MKKNTKQKIKNTNKVQAKKNRKAIIIGLIALVILIAGIWTGFYIRKKINDRTVHIAFYGLSDEYVNLLKEYIPQEEKVILKYDVIAPGAMDLSIITRKYDMLFTWKGEVTDSLAGGIEDIPGKILDNIPTSLRNKKCLPILLDHYEFDIYKPTMEKTGINPSENFTQLTNYLNAAKDYVFSPFFTNGGDDRTLLAFIGVLTEAMGGLKAYNKLIEAMKPAQSLSDFIDVELADLPGEKLTVRYILDMLKTWPTEGITHPQWYRGNFNDLQTFAEDNQLAGFFTSLSQHRTIKYSIVSNFETIRIPGLSNNVDHALIAPAISGLLITDNSNSKKILATLISADVQDALSTKTMLAPVHYRAEAYDIQSDDVRFWAASCAGGPLPDLYLAVYQRQPEKFAEMANEVRAYIK